MGSTFWQPPKDIPNPSKSVIQWHFCSRSWDTMTTRHSNSKGGHPTNRDAQSFYQFFVSGFHLCIHQAHGQIVSARWICAPHFQCKSTNLRVIERGEQVAEDFTFHLWPCSIAQGLVLRSCLSCFWPVPTRLGKQLPWQIHIIRAQEYSNISRKSCVFVAMVLRQNLQKKTL